MSSIDLVIVNGKILGPNGNILRAGIGIEDGRIVSIGNDVNLPRADEIIDAGGKIVLPGMIDMHVHFRDPGFTYKEDFVSGTKAAAAGGVTTAVDMPNSAPQTNTVEKFEEKKIIAERKAVIDFSLYAFPAKLDNVTTFVEAGAIGFKIYMTRLRPDFSDISILDDSILLDTFKAIAETDVPACVHLDNPNISGRIRERLKATGRKDHLVRIDLREASQVAEVEATARAIILAEEAGVKLHICHVLSWKAIELIQYAKSRGVNVTAEMMPARLVITMDDLHRLGPNIWAFPVEREKHMKEIFQALREGTVDAFATDHAPHTKEEKAKGWENIWEMWQSGSPQLQYALPMLLTVVNKGSLSIHDLVRLYSTNPAKILGIYPRKGAIWIGSDADLTIVDLKKEIKITSDNLYSKAGYTPFEGKKAKGVPIRTIVRGETVMENGVVTGKPGHGVLIRRQ
jgi:dihydroorotase (multifunctional complex type)